MVQKFVAYFLVTFGYIYIFSICAGIDIQFISFGFVE